MTEFLTTYWPHILTVLSVIFGAIASIHATMTKRNVRSAVGWVGIIMLSPIVGALIYAVAGVNRMFRNTMLYRRSDRFGAIAEAVRNRAVTDEQMAEQLGARFRSLKSVGDHITRHPLTAGNTIRMLESGDEAYGAMKATIDNAQRSILLETYIFDRDPLGLEIADCLIAAAARGVEVRVLIDAVGARYSAPSILGYLRDGGVRCASFNGKVIFGLRLPYSNLRTHRKILIADGAVAFFGGMNIRHAFTREGGAHDTHFSVRGPIVASLFSVAAEDWHFETGEYLESEAWEVGTEEWDLQSRTMMRSIVTGPDRHIENNQKIMMGAFSVAEQHILIMSPYFLPDSELLSALATAARRGVEVDIVVPDKNNLELVSRAMTAQFDQVLRDGSRIWRAQGKFDHSKLMVVDGKWALVGSSNLDSRSLRLNFEIDAEIYDPEFVGKIAARIEKAKAGATAVSVAQLRARPFLARLFNRVLWLASPYL